MAGGTWFTSSDSGVVFPIVRVDFEIVDVKRTSWTREASLAEIAHIARVRTEIMPRSAFFPSEES